MSIAQQLDFVNSVDSRLAVLENKKPKYNLPKGVKAIDYRNLPSQNATSTTGTQYTIQLNENQILSNYIVEEITFSATFTVKNTTAPAYVFNNAQFAPRVSPIDNISQNIQIIINGQSINVNPQDMLTPLMAFNKDPAYDGKDLPCCSMLDTYADLGTVAAAATFENQSGSLKNPLLDYFASTYGNTGRFCDMQLNAGCNNAVLPIDNSSQARVINFTVRQPIFTGATSLVNDHSGGFLGATNVQINRTFVSNLGARLFEWIAPSANCTLQPNGIAVAISGATLYYVVYTPDDSFVLPKNTFYPILDYGTYTNTPASAACNPNVVTTISSQTLNLTVIPKCIYVWVAVPNSAKTVGNSDAPGYQIQNINMTFNGVGGQFSSMTDPIQLYNEFCLRSGYIKTFSETGYAWTSAVGGAGNDISNNRIGLFGLVCRIDAGSIGGIPWDKVSVGSQFNSSIQMTVQALNLSASANTPSLFIQVVNDALLEIDGPTSAKLYKGILSQDEVRAIRQSAPYDLEYHPMLGGNFFKNAFNKIKRVGKELYNNKDELLKIGKKVLGAGHKRRHSHKRHHMRGGAISDSDDYSDSDTDGTDETYSSNTSDYTSSSDDSLPRGNMKGGKLVSKNDLRRRL